MKREFNKEAKRCPICENIIPEGEYYCTKYHVHKAWFNK